MNPQAAFDVRFERGEAGLRAVAPTSRVVIVVDALSFSSAVDVAVGRGAVILPYRYADPTARAFAERHGARLAVPRWERNAAQPCSLSPSSLLDVPAGTRLVLPSPNGSTLLAIARTLCPDAHLLVGSLRNAATVAAFAGRDGGDGPIAVIAAGERWSDGTLRPALEDDLAAGAIIAALDARNASPEATCAAAAFTALKDRLTETLRSCTTATELQEAGYAADVAFASALNVSRTVPHVDRSGEISDATDPTARQVGAVTSDSA